MPRDATPAYRIGDLLALARQSWTRRMARELANRGYGDYRISDAATMRLLLAGPVTVGRLGEVLGVSRQAARKVAGSLESRGYAVTRTDPDDARKVNVVLTASGGAYGRAVVAVIESLNRLVSEQVDPEQLISADAVLRAVMDSAHREAAADIPPPLPPRSGSSRR